jgi:hypothetical protein
MAIGLPPDQQGLNAEITAAAVALSAANSGAAALARKINKLQATGQLAAIYPNAPDQQAAATLAGWLANLSGVFYGTATQAAAFDYDDGLTPYYP